LRFKDSFAHYAPRFKFSEGVIVANSSKLADAIFSNTPRRFSG
jgi:hypothetical protein